MLPAWRGRRHPTPLSMAMRKQEEKSEGWIVDGEIHEIGDHVPPRERFVIPRDNITNKRRKRPRDQFMRRSRLVLKEAEHEPWCKRYMELYQELRENWERVYWDEGHSKKIAQDHANYESAEDDDHDFSPYGNKRFHPEPYKDNGFGSRQGDTWEKVNQIRDKFEYDRERRMREKGFAPMSGEASPYFHDMNSRRQPNLQNLNSRRQPNVHDMNSRRQPFDAQRYFSDSGRERRRTTNGLCTYICTRQEAWKGAAFPFHLFLNCHCDDFWYLYYYLQPVAYSCSGWHV
ncbi:uncharacterized protein LOC126622707 [Malus sylvestris]|uniref:uncharacterized protein LOC126622707 n=1 Tax=Malus sylvestris TaxID=3752 RepID=UPI0021AD361F|nr:uncharacterized protein LOC126622707 [Malus sylvestris]